MSRLFVGTIDGVPCVKATKLNTDVPWTVPDNQYAKFLFNSRNQNAYVYEVFSVSLWNYSFPGVGNTQTYYLPSGSNASNASYKVVAVQTSQNATTNITLSAMFENMGFSYEPIVEMRMRSTAGTSLGPRYRSTVNNTGQIRTFTASLPYSDTVVRNPGSSSTYHIATASVWELPATNVALPQDGANAAGRMAVRLTQTHAQVARVGFDVRTAPNTGFILNSDRPPAKIVASGSTFVMPNDSTTVPITTTFDLTQDMYVDYLVQHTTQDLFHPPLVYIDGWSTGAIAMDHRIDVAAKTITFSNGDITPLRVRWILLADDAAGTTTGGTRVAYRGNDGVEDFYQIKRPGSSDIAPRFDDILLDTRFQTLRLVDEGYLPWADFTETPEDTRLGARRKTVSFVNTGFKPFVKYVVTRGGGDYTGFYFPPWYHPQYQRFQITNLADPDNLDGITSATSTLARIFDTSVRFYMSRDNPWRVYRQVDGGEKAQGDYYSGDAATTWLPTGIRYYIFALPE